MLNSAEKSWISKHVVDLKLSEQVYANNNHKMPLFSRVRIPAKHVYYYRCPDHRKNYVMSFSFCFDKEDDVYQFGYCYPYSYTRLQNYLDNLEKKDMDFFSRELLCLTVVMKILCLFGFKYMFKTYSTCHF